MESGGNNFRIAVQILGEDKTLEYLEQQKELILDGTIKPFIDKDFTIHPEYPNVHRRISGTAYCYNLCGKIIAEVEHKRHAPLEWFIDDHNYSRNIGEHSKVKINSFRTLIEECILLIINEYF